MTSEQHADSRGAILATQDLLKQFASVKAINYLSIAIPMRGITSIIGPNGSGKSTLINLLSGTLPIDGGIVIIQGTSMRVVLPHRSPSHGITRTFQEVRLFNQMTVLDNILVAHLPRFPFGAQSGIRSVASAYLSRWPARTHQQPLAQYAL